MDNKFDYTVKFEGVTENKNILSGDSSYITSHKDARTVIRKYERDELLEEILKSYLSK